MPRKFWGEGSGEGDNFKDRSYLLKSEAEVALIAPQGFDESMRRLYRPSAKPVKFQIRLIGPVTRCMAQLASLKIAHPNILYRIMKVNRDRSNRNSKDFVSDSIRVYIEVR